MLAITDPDDRARMMQGLDIGVNDSHAADRHAGTAGAGAQPDAQAATPTSCAQRAKSMELAVTDALTGLHNRRYMENHRARWSNRRHAAASRSPC